MYMYTILMGLSTKNADSLRDTSPSAFAYCLTTPIYALARARRPPRARFFVMLMAAARPLRCGPVPVRAPGSPEGQSTEMYIS